MPKKPSEIDDLGSFIPIVSSLKENSEYLKSLLNEVRTIGNRMDYISESSTLKKIEERMNRLENDIRNLSKFSQPTPQETQSLTSVTGVTVSYTHLTLPTTPYV